MKTLRARLRAARFHVGVNSDPGRRISQLLKRLDLLFSPRRNTPVVHDGSAAIFEGIATGSPLALYADLLPVLRNPQAFGYLKLVPASGSSSAIFRHITAGNDFCPTSGNASGKDFCTASNPVFPGGASRPEKPVKAEGIMPNFINKLCLINFRLKEVYDTIRFTSGLGNIVKGAVKKAAVPVGIGLTYMASFLPGSADGALITHEKFSQSGNSAAAYLKVENNDPSSTYNSATLDLGTLLSEVTDAVVKNNDSYSTNQEVLDAINVSIRGPPEGDVKTGWSTSLNGATLNFSHIGGIPNLSYDNWDVAKPDLALTLNFGNMLDFNANNILDPNEELYLKPNSLPDVFVGTFDDLNSWSASGQPYGVQTLPVPEPSSFLLGIIAAYAATGRHKRKN